MLLVLLACCTAVFIGMVAGVGVWDIETGRGGRSEGDVQWDSQMWAAGRESAVGVVLRCEGEAWGLRSRGAQRAEKACRQPVWCSGRRGRGVELRAMSGGRERASTLNGRTSQLLYKPSRMMLNSVP